jgi:putative inorganic carbon (hco3(-)) transporter
MTVEKTEGKSNLHHPQWLEHALVVAATMFLSSMYFSIAVNSLSFGLMALAWLGIMLAQRRNLIISTSLDWFFLAYVFAEMLSTLFSVRPEQSLLFSKRLLLIAVVYFFASTTTSEKRAKWYIAVLLGSAAIVASIGVLKLIFGDPETTKRLGIFQFYMTTSELMMMSALLVVPFIIHPKTPVRVRWVALVGLIPIMISLYATVTRGAYLATAAGLLFIAFVRNRKLLVPFFAVVALFAVFAPHYVQDRLKSIVDLAHPENASRLMLWSAGLRIFADYPIVGVGDIDLHDLFVQYSPPGSDLPWGHLHNVPLQLLVTLGGVGFMIVAAMLVRISVVEWRTYTKVREEWLAGSFVLGTLAVFVGFQINGLTEWSFGDQEVVLLFWTTLGLTLALGRLTEKGSATTTAST